MEHSQYEKERDRAMGLVEQHVDETWTRDGVYDLLIKHGIDPTIANGIASDILLGEDDV